MHVGASVTPNMLLTVTSSIRAVNTPRKPYRFKLLSFVMNVIYLNDSHHGWTHHSSCCVHLYLDLNFATYSRIVLEDAVIV